MSLLVDPFEEGVREDISQEPPEGSNCEVSFQNARYNTSGVRTFLKSGVKRYFDTPKTSDKASSALCVTRYYDKAGDLEYTETAVRSVHIKKALKSVLKPDFHDINVEPDTVTARNLPRSLFFHHKELTAYGRSLDDGEAARHISLVLEYLFQELGPNIRTFRENVEANIEAGDKDPVLDFNNLWMVFCPGDLVAIKVQDKFQVRRVARISTIKRHHVPIELWSLTCDGATIGYRWTREGICSSQCIGFTSLRDLPIVPLKYLAESQRKEILDEARIRGEKFLRLSVGIHHCDYQGLAEMTKGVDAEEDLYDEITQMVNGRIIIDSQKFSEMRPNNVPCLTVKQTKYNIRKGEHKNIPDSVKLIASHDVLGFSLKYKRWGTFNLNFCHDVRYNDQAFSKLILPSLQKDLVRSVVTAHEKGKLGFDDIIEGKGKGMTILLHGTPGVGKTLTAESVADHAKMPLYAVTAAEFLDTVDAAESKLNHVFELAAHWNAVLLIDEADIILARRTFAEMERNAIVAVFLQAMEYFSGVLILTTNRVTSLDAAFRSRIHLGIKYRPLSTDIRRQIWQNFLVKPLAGGQAESLQESVLDELSAYSFDGRMIKNAVRMAYAMAVDEDVMMGLSHIRKAAEALETFGSDMEEADAEDRQDQAISAIAGEGSRKRKRSA